MNAKIAGSGARFWQMLVKLIPGDLATPDSLLPAGFSRTMLQLQHYYVAITT